MTLDLGDITAFDWTDTASDPMDRRAVCEKTNLVDRIVQDARAMAQYEAIKLRGKRLRQRLGEVGIQSEPVIGLVGTKS